MALQVLAETDCRMAPNLYVIPSPITYSSANYLVMKNKLPNFEMIGYVINDKHPKTIRVACDRYMYVMRYKKAFRYTKKVWAHDENSEAKLGDIVQIQPLGYRIGPWKTYCMRKIIHREGVGQAERLRASDVRNMVVQYDKQESLDITKLPSRIE